MLKSKIFFACWINYFSGSDWIDIAGGKSRKETHQTHSSDTHQTHISDTHHTHISDTHQTHSSDTRQTYNLSLSSLSDNHMTYNHR